MSAEPNWSPAARTVSTCCCSHSSLSLKLMNPGGAGSKPAISGPGWMRSAMSRASCIGFARAARARRSGRLVAKSPWSGLFGRSISMSGAASTLITPSRLACSKAAATIAATASFTSMLLIQLGKDCAGIYMVASRRISRPRISRPIDDHRECAGVGSGYAFLGCARVTGSQGGSHHPRTTFSANHVSATPGTDRQSQ